MNAPSFTAEDGWTRYRKPVQGEPTDSAFLTYYPEAGFLIGAGYTRLDDPLELLAALSDPNSDTRLFRSWVIVTFGSQQGDIGEMRFLLLSQQRPSYLYDLTSSYSISALQRYPELCPPVRDPVNREIWYRPNFWWIKEKPRKKPYRNFEIPGFTTPAKT